MSSSKIGWASHSNLILMCLGQWFGPSASASVAQSATGTAVIRIDVNSTTNIGMFEKIFFF